MPFTEVRVRATRRRAGPGRAEGTLTLIASGRMENDGVTAGRAPESTDYDEDSQAELYVVANDDPDTYPPGRSYRVLDEMVGEPLRTFTVVIPRGAPVVDGYPTVDLADLDPLVDPPPLELPMRRIRQATDYDDMIPPLDGQVLAWDATDQRWRPITAAGGGGSGDVFVVEHTQAVAQSVWTITHAAARPVSWSLRTAADQQATGYVVDPLDTTHTRVSMDDPTAGTVRILMRSL